MPYGYHLNLDEGLITVSITEEVPLEEAAAFTRQMLADPRYDPLLPQLIDVRGLTVTRTPRDSADFKDFVLREYRPRAHASIAIVVDDSLDQRSLASLYHLSCSRDKTEVFDHYERALKWLMRAEFV